MTKNFINSWSEIQEAKDYLIKKDDCKDFEEYSWKHGLLIERKVPWFLFFERTIGYERDMIKTIEHLRKARLEIKNSKNK